MENSIFDVTNRANVQSHSANKLETPQSDCSNIVRESGFKGPLAKIKFQELNRQAIKGIVDQTTNYVTHK